MESLTKQKIIDLVKSDSEMMSVLAVVESLNLPDWMICAGFIRNKVWDYIHNNNTKTQPSDVDVMFFDFQDRNAAIDIRKRLENLRPDIGWDIENQAFSHESNNDSPYRDTLDALSKLPETVTSIGIKSCVGELSLIAPHGIGDLVNCVIRPTPIFYRYPERKQIVIERLQEKKLFAKWSKLKVMI
jgi:uncharacterized protein